MDRAARWRRSATPRHYAADCNERKPYDAPDGADGDTGNGDDAGGGVAEWYEVDNDDWTEYTTQNKGRVEFTRRGAKVYWRWRWGSGKGRRARYGGSIDSAPEQARERYAANASRGADAADGGAG